MRTRRRASAFTITAMHPVEINPGAWYLRALRADDRIADRPGLAELGEVDADYVARRCAQWANETCYSWAVCEQTTGELLAEVTLDPRTAGLASRARDGHAGAAEAGEHAVRRFAASVLGHPPMTND